VTDGTLPLSILADGPVFEVQVVPFRIWEALQPARAAVGERRELPAALTLDPDTRAALLLAEIAAERRISDSFELRGNAAGLVEEALMADRARARSAVAGRFFNLLFVLGGDGAVRVVFVGAGQNAGLQ